MGPLKRRLLAAALKAAQDKDVSLSSTTCLHCGSKEHQWNLGLRRVS